MSNLQQSDLILAGRYVDGDLPAHEVATTEARIVKDADFAAAVEQIRQQSTLIQRLPKFKPADDLAERTLHASMDQVKAIMGVWPIENTDDKVTPSSTQPSTDGVDWKSTAALVASLAGIFLIGTMLWQNWNGSSSDVAMSDSVATSAEPGLGLASKQLEGESADMLANAVNDEETQPFGKSANELPLAPSKEAMELDDQVAVQGIAQQAQVPTFDNFSGTRMKKAPSRPGGSTNAITNTSAPVEQIWCVNQDRSAAKNAVSEILQLNRIDVQLDQQEKIASATPDTVEAFYVAATPGQMKLAMSQISNSADIEMIQLPSGTNSPIADVIQQQFVQRPPAAVNDGQQQRFNSELPPRLRPPATNAMAQQIVSNVLPRNMPAGPIPPILKSGSPIDGLNESAPAELTARQQTASRATNPAGAGLGGMGGANIEAEKGMADIAQAQQQQQSKPMPQQSAEYDKYLDDSDQQLRQYLIIVRGAQENQNGR